MLKGNVGYEDKGKGIANKCAVTSVDQTRNCWLILKGNVRNNTRQSERKKKNKNSSCDSTSKLIDPEKKGNEREKL